MKLKPAHAVALVNNPTAFDLNGTWSDVDGIDESGNDNVDDKELTMDLLKLQLDVEFFSKFRAWRAHPAKAIWAKVGSNVVIRYSSASNMLETVALNVGSLYKGLNKEQFGHLPAMAS